MGRDRIPGREAQRQIEHLDPQEVLGGRERLWGGMEDIRVEEDGLPMFCAVRGPAATKAARSTNWRRWRVIMVFLVFGDSPIDALAQGGWPSPERSPKAVFSRKVEPRLPSMGLG